MPGLLPWKGGRLYMVTKTMTIILIGIGITIFALFARKELNAKVKKKAIILIGMGATILALLFYGYWTEWRFDRVRVSGKAMHYVHDYEEYYFKAEDGSGRFIYAYDYKKIYFLSRQRNKMLEKIKEDVSSDLNSIIENYGDLFYRYEISDDFKQVCIYETSHDSRYWRYYIGSSQLASLIELYHNLKESRPASIHQAVKFIEANSTEE
jgi:hypothetical protein